jgi:hypothetical protein
VLLCLALFVALLAHTDTFRCRQWFYSLRWRPPDGPGFLDSGQVRLALLAGVLTPLLLRGGRVVPRAAWAAFAFSAASCLALLLRETHGLPLYRDDHPSFIFRLWEFGRAFPRFVTYNPYWNAGTADGVLLTTGVSSVGLPAWPLWRFAAVADVYTPALGVYFAVLMPLLAALSLRVMGAGWTAAGCAATLALGISQRYFLWMLHYGTVGASFASAFVLPVAACAFRVVWLRRREPWLFALLVVSSLFLASWPPGLIMGGGVALAVLVNAGRVSRRGALFLAAFAAAFAAAMAYPASLILGMKELLGFVSQGGASTAAGAGLADPLAIARKGWATLLTLLGEGHPLIVFLGVLGVVFSPHRSVRRWFAPIVVYLGVLAGWGELFRPKLQLMRMAIPMMFVAVAPAAVACARLLATRQAALAPVRALIVALLLLGGWNTATIYGNRWHAPYVTMNPGLLQMSAWLRENVPPAGRVLFPGKTVHAFGRGHVAPLPIFAGREMMAFDYYHFPSGEYNYPPARYRKTHEGLMRFFELYNVTHLVTYQSEWNEFLGSRPDLYEAGPTFGDKTVYAVRRAPSMFLKGAGTAAADFNRIRLTLSDPAAEAVVKYAWADGLKADPPAEAFAFAADADVTLVGIRPNGAASVTVRY